MWSNNKKVDLVVNILIFLLAINIFHYGQFILPVICLLLFIDNKFRFKVNSWFIFIVLCLFGISFFVFSYKLGFYSVMGFCIPMAYYIGSNIKDASENNIKKLIYIIAFGMASHVLLNFIYDLSVFGLDYINARSHFDIWLGVKIKETITAVNYMILIGSIYYIIIYEKNRFIKISGIILFVLLFIYNIGLGRRTPILMLIGSICLSLILDFVAFKGKNIKKVMIVIAMLLAPIALVIIMYAFNIFGLKQWLSMLMVVDKFLWMGLKSERLSLFLKAIEIAPNYLWGGQLVSNSVGIYIHDLWMDTYDYAGVVPYILLIIYTLTYIINSYKLFKNSNVSNDIKKLVFPLLAVIFVQLHLDPIMTGSSIFLIVVVLIGGSLERLNGK